MAKKEVNKSQLIRDYKGANPKASAKQIKDALAAEGHEVSTVLIYTVLGKAKSKRKKAGRRKAAASEPAVAATGGNGEAFSLNSLLQAKKFASQMGSIAEAKKALDALYKLS